MKSQDSTLSTNTHKSDKKNHHSRRLALSTSDEILMSKKSVVQIRLTEAKKNIWEEYAKNEEKSMTQFVTDAVDDKIQNILILKLLDEKFEGLKEQLLREIKGHRN